MAQIEQAETDAALAEVDVTAFPAGSRCFSRQTWLCASCAVLVPLVLTIPSLFGALPMIKPTHLTVDASESGQSVHGLLEADYTLSWLSFGQLHKPELRDVACQIHVGGSPALSIHMTEVQSDASRISAAFEIVDISPRLIVLAIAGADGTGVECNVDVALNLWRTGLAVTHSFRYETHDRIPGTSGIELVRHEHNISNPTREDINATIVANYTVEWTLSSNSAIADFLRKTPVYVKADAGFMEMHKRSAEGFIGVSSYIQPTELQDGGLHAALPLQTSVRLDIPALAGVGSDAVIETTNGLTNGHDHDALIDLMVTPEGAPLARLLGSYHQLHIYTSRNEIDPSEMSGHDIMGHGRRLSEPSGFFMMNRLNLDGTSLMGIDISMTGGELFEVRMNVFQTFFEDAADNWGANFSLIANEEMAELSLKSHASPTLTVNASVRLDVASERFDVHMANAEGINLTFTIDGQTEFFRTELINGVETNITVLLDVPAQQAQLSVLSATENFALRAGIDVPAETAMVLLTSHDLNFTGELQPSSVMVDGRINAGGDTIALAAAKDFNGDGVGHIFISYPQGSILGNYTRTSSVAPVSPETIVLSLLMQEDQDASTEKDDSRMVGTSATYKASMHLSMTMTMTTEEHVANTTHRLGVGLLMAPRCVENGAIPNIPIVQNNAFPENAMCKWRQRDSGSESVQSCCWGAMPMQMNPGIGIGESLTIGSGMDLRLVEYPSSSDMTMLFGMDVSNPAAPKARVDYREFANGGRNITSVVHFSETERVMATLQWQDTNDVFTAAALVDSGSQQLSAGIRYDDVNGDGSITGAVHISETESVTAKLQWQETNDVFTAAALVDSGSQQLSAGIRHDYVNGDGNITGVVHLSETETVTGTLRWQDAIDFFTAGALVDTGSQQLSAGITYYDVNGGGNITGVVHLSATETVTGTLRWQDANDFFTAEALVDTGSQQLSAGITYYDVNGNGNITGVVHLSATETVTGTLRWQDANDFFTAEALVDTGSQQLSAGITYYDVNGGGNITGVVHLSETERVTGTFRWQVAKEFFTGEALVDSGSERLSAGVRYDHFNLYLHRINGTIAMNSENLIYVLVIVENNSRLLAGSARIQSGTWQEIASGGLSWMEEGDRHTQEIRANASMNSLGHASLVFEDSQQRKYSRVLVTDSASPMLDLNVSMVGNGLTNGTLNVSGLMDTTLNVSEIVKVTVGATTTEPLVAFDIEVLRGNNYELGGHAEVTHPNLIFLNDANRVLKLQSPFRLLGWADHSDEGTRARLIDMSWLATDGDGNLSSRLVVRNGSAFEVLVWTCYFDDANSNAMDIRSNLTLEGEDVMSLTGSLAKTADHMDGELVLFDGDSSQSLYVNASNGFVVARTRPTGFDVFHVAVGTVIDGNQANCSVYLERGPDVQVSGFGYSITIFNGTQVHKTVMYEGTGDIDLVPGEAPPPPPGRAVTPIKMALEVTDLSTFSTTDMVAVISQASGSAREDIRIESVTAEITTTYAVDSSVEPEDLRRAVAVQLNVPISQVSVSLAGGRRLHDEGRRLVAVSYDVLIQTQDLEKAEQVRQEATDTAALTTALHTVVPDAPPPIIEAPPIAQVVMETTIVSVDETPVEAPTNSALDVAIVDVVGGIGAVLKIETTTMVTTTTVTTTTVTTTTVTTTTVTTTAVTTTAVTTTADFTNADTSTMVVSRVGDASSGQRCAGAAWFAGLAASLALACSR